jgi:ElaB/YqjD/DUF883 family membrane-anchored ribosome-binding protein
MPDRARRHVQRVPENQPGYREANSAFLRAEIRDTRERMSETLDELGDRLNPNRLKAQVKANIREATVGRVENMARNAADRVNETRHGMIDRIRENPIPAAMVGIGLGWLFFGGRRHDATVWERSHVTGDNYDGTAYVGDVSATTPRLIQDDAAGGMGESISRDPGVVDRVRDTVSDIGETVRDTTSEVASSARERAGDVGERVSESAAMVADRARGVAQGVGHRARHGMHAATDRFDQTLNENPMALGAVALAVGMAAGLAIPESRREREMLGQYRDDLVGRVRDKVEDTRDRVQNVAERVVEESKDVAREAARDEGLVS